MANSYTHSIDSNKTTLFNASAGSGKTFTLINVLARQIFDAYREERPVYEKPLKRFLATTFTNASAADMKGKILEFFAELIQNNADNWLRIGISDPSSDDRYTALDIFGDILHQYNLLNVCTIDSFFKRLALGFSDSISQHADAIDVRIDDSEEVEDAKSRYLYTVNQKLEDYSLFYSLLKKYIDGDQRPSDFLYKYLNESLKQYRLTKFDKYRSQNKAMTPDESHTLLNDVNEAIASIESDLVNTTKEWTAIYTDNVLAFNGTKSKSIQSLSTEPENVLNLTIDSRVILTIMKNLEKQEYLKKNQSFNQPEQEQTFYDLGQKLIQLLLQRTCLSEMQEKLQEDLIGIEVYHYLNEYKQDQNIFTLQDLSDELHHLVVHEGFYNVMYERTALRYQHYFIDEFQDTSHGQWANFKPLIEEALAANEGRSSAMLVGDGKQAIYRFRGGDIANFNSLLNDDEVDKKDLSSNFRSDPKIIDFVRDFFFDSFVKKLLLQDEMATVYKEKPTTLKTSGGMVSIDLLTKPEKGEEPLPENTWEAVMVKRVQELLDAGIQPQQIALLCFTRTEIKTAIHHLRQAGIYQVSSEDKIPIQSFVEVQATFDLWKLLYHNRDRATLYQFMVKYAQLKSADLLQLAQNIQAKSHWLDILSEVLPIERHKIDTHNQVYSQMLFCCRTLELYDNLYVQSFLSLIRELPYTDKTPHNLIQLWHKTADPFWQIETEFDKSSIKLYTVHKSKGLQFDYVILPNLLKVYTDQHDDDYLWIEASDFAKTVPVKFPPSLKQVRLGRAKKWAERLLMTIKEDGENVEVDTPICKSLSNNWIQSIHNQMGEKTSELLNAYYVALTRAIKGMYIISQPKGKLTSVSKLFREDLIAFTENSEYEKTQENDHHCRYTLGKDFVPLADQASDDSTDSIYLAEPQTSLWQPKPYSSSVDTTWGKAVHLALEHIVTPKDIPWAIQRASHTYPDIDTVALEAVLNQTVSQPELHSIFFGETHPVFNEMEVLTTEGLNRIDRYAQMGDKGVLLDFKTGKPKKGDQEQIAKYIHAFELMGTELSHAYLYYTESNALVDLLAQ